MPSAPADGWVFEVLVRHNLVHALRRVPRALDAQVPPTRLEVSAQLAANQQAHGCIDGCYRFDDAERARSFAVLALDFVKCQAERRTQQLENLDTGADYDADAPPRGGGA